MEIRCDESMKRSKENAGRWSWNAYGIPQWKCTKDCERCICGMKQGEKGVWEHNGYGAK